MIHLAPVSCPRLSRVTRLCVPHRSTSHQHVFSGGCSPGTWLRVAVEPEIERHGIDPGHACHACYCGYADVLWGPGTSCGVLWGGVEPACLRGPRGTWGKPQRAKERFVRASDWIRVVRSATWLNRVRR